MMQQKYITLIFIRTWITRKLERRGWHMMGHVLFHTSNTCNFELHKFSVEGVLRPIPACILEVTNVCTWTWLLDLQFSASFITVQCREATQYYTNCACRWDRLRKILANLINLLGIFFVCEVGLCWRKFCYNIPQLKVM